MARGKRSPRARARFGGKRRQAGDKVTAFPRPPPGAPAAQPAGRSARGLHGIGRELPGGGGARAAGRGSARARGVGVGEQQPRGPASRGGMAAAGKASSRAAGPCVAAHRSGPGSGKQRPRDRGGSRTWVTGCRGGSATAGPPRCHQ